MTTSGRVERIKAILGWATNAKTKSRVERLLAAMGKRHPDSMA